MNTSERTVRLQFARTGAQRFLSHLDLMGLFQRACRRALLPLAQPRGQAAKPRISLPYPLPLGVEAENEVLEADLEFPIPLGDVAARLNEQLPEGLTIHDARWVPGGERRALSGLRYRVCGDGLPTAARIQEFLETPTCMVERNRNDRRVTVDIRPFVETVGRAGTCELSLSVKVDAGRSTRPDELLRALGLDDEALAGLDIVRTEVIESVA